MEITANDVNDANDPNDALAECNPAEDDGDSISEASTVAYEHEPFETFRHKVAELMAEKFNCDSTAIRTEHISGGSFNRIIGVEVHEAVPKRGSCFDWAYKLLRKLLGKSDFQAYIVRIARGDMDDLDCQIATLKTVGARLPFSTPEVVHYDLSSENVLEKSYMVQERIPGRQVYGLLDIMNLEQKKDMLLQVICLINQTTSIEAAPGNISADNLTSSTDEPVRVNKVSAAEKDIVPSTTKNSVDHLLEVIEMRRTRQIECGFCFYDIWDSFVAICKSLESRGFLEGPSVLVHNDFWPRNLLAEITSPSTVNITGVIDWDDAYFAPKVMALRSPFWLWTANDNTTSFDDWLEVPATVEPANKDDQLLRRIFLETASEEYTRFAFCPEAILARRMYHYLRSGIHEASEAIMAERLIREWDEMHPEDNVKLGEGYFNADCSWKHGALAKCGNWSDAESDIESDSEDEDRNEDKNGNESENSDKEEDVENHKSL
ncbi:hypothetical protein DE146DRAFT_616157 [Phaeosphaeria sp. MPI-PUGE-AT-0046c]|nr:hypothetical protein DE146DRAFT_616157 [Phaeosphaeria sp. MPI-PUGE-AT-0046c]